MTRESRLRYTGRRLGCASKRGPTARTGSPGRPPPARRRQSCAPTRSTSFSRATGALDEVRREVWRTARQAGAITPVRHGSRMIRISAGDARSLARARCALRKNPENLTGRQEAKLAWIEKTHPCLYRACLLKEGLRTAFKLKGEEGRKALTRWLSRAARCRIPEFVELGKKIRRHLPSTTQPWTTGSATA
jgi:transposase